LPTVAKAWLRADRQCGKGVSPAFRQARSDSTEYAGRAAGRGKSAVVVGKTRDGSAPSSWKIALAKLNQVVDAPFVQWYMPAGTDGDRPSST